ncbi:hypothetical protein ACI2LC_18855 [Nonomuraea wenchangensis]|uniref:hypothetical protein n=1 Tax=Nonomuraea wenchangensis TaxID=568860 RepID=UPI00384A9E64
MFRLLAVLAAAVPAVLASVLPGETCGYFGYRMPEPSALAVALYSPAGWGADLLPVALALTGLWLPRRFPVLGAALSGLVLLLGGLTFLVPYVSICGTTQGLGLVTGCAAAATAACLLARLDTGPRRIPAAVTAAWTTVLCLALAGSLTEDDRKCFPGLTYEWATWWIRLDSAEMVGLWVAVAALGSVLVSGRGATAAAVALLVPALYTPLATVLSGAAHDCSDLVGWPYVAAAVIGAMAARSARDVTPADRG